MAASRHSRGKHVQVHSNPAAGVRGTSADGPAWLREKPWVPPDKDEAQRRARAKMLANGTASLCTCNTGILADLGQGVAGYFAVIRVMALVFIAMSASSGAALYAIGLGSRLPAASALAQITLGNLGRIDNATSWGAEPVPEAVDMAVIAAVANAIILGLAAFWVLPWIVERTASSVDRQIISTGDYSVFVRAIPSDATAEEVANHFSRLYNLQAPDPMEGNTCCCCNFVSRRQFDPDTPENRAARVEEVARTPGERFSRTTADPVQSIDHILDARLDTGHADPSGWRQAELVSARTATVVADRNRRLHPTSHGSDAGRDSDGRESSPDEAAAMEDGFETVVAESAVQAAAAEHGADGEGPTLKERKEVIRATFPGPVGEHAAVMLGSWVADVTMVYNNGRAIRHARKHMKTLQRIDKEKERARKELAEGTHTGLRKRIRTVERMEKSAERQLRKGPRWLENHAIAAFVTFEHEESRRRCLYDYEHRRACCTGRLPAKLKFRGTRNIIVSETDEPDEIAWENLDVPPKLRSYLRAFGCALATIVLALIVWAIIWARLGADSVTNSLIPQDECLRMVNKFSSVPASSMDDVLVAKCSGGAGRSVSTKGIAVATNLSIDCAPGACIANAHDPECASTGRTFVQLSNCICQAKFQRSIISGVNTVLTFFDDNPACGSGVALLFGAQILAVIAGIVISVGNMILRVMLGWATRREMHPTVTAEANSQAFKVTIAQLINTVLVVILVNANVPEIRAGLPWFPILTGRYTDMSPEWFAEVGVALTVAMLTTVALPIIRLVTSVLRGTCCRSLRDSCCAAASMQELVDRYSFPEFNVAAKFPLLITVTLLCCAYGTAIPIIAPLAAVFTLVSGAVDWLTIARGASRPPPMSDALARGFVSVLRAGFFVHTAMSIWLLASPELEGGDPSRHANIGVLESAVRRWGTVSVLVLSFLLGGAIVIAVLRCVIGDAFSACVRVSIRLLTCGTLCQRAGGALRQEDPLLPPFSGTFRQAVEDVPPNALSGVGRLVVPDPVRMGAHKCLEQRFTAEDESTHGWRQPQGGALRTWEAIRRMQTPTYEPEANPRYSLIFKGSRPAALSPLGDGTVISASSGAAASPHRSRSAKRALLRGGSAV